MDKAEEMQAYREQYEAGEIDADDYEVALLGIEYQYGEAMSAQDDAREVTA